MTPPAVTDRADTAADILDSLRTRLSDKEKERFDLELYSASRSGNPVELRGFVEGWSATILVRDHPGYAAHYEGFMSLVRSGHPFGETRQAAAI